MSLPFPRRLALVVLLGLLCGGAAAQVVPLDDTWFRLSLRAVGNRVQPGTLLPKPGKLKAKAFLHLQLAEPLADGGQPDGITYAWVLWTKQDGGAWAQSASGQQAFVGGAAGDQLAVDLPLEVQLEDGRFFTARAVLRFDLKLGQQGQLKRARVRELGGAVIDGSTDGVDFLAGRLDAVGHDVAPGKLPFAPP